MSLINGMLKDLEQRKRELPAPSAFAGYPQASVPPPSPARWTAIPAFAQATLTVLVAGAVASWVAHKEPTAAAPGPAQPSIAAPQQMPEPAASHPPPALVRPPMLTAQAVPAPAVPGPPAPEQAPAMAERPTLRPEPAPAAQAEAAPGAPAGTARTATASAREDKPATGRKRAPRQSESTPTPAGKAAAPEARSVSAATARTPTPGGKAPEPAANVQAAPQVPAATVQAKAMQVAASQAPAAPVSAAQESPMAKADRLYAQALELRKQGQIEPCLAALQASLAANPRQVQARLLQASLLVERKDPGRAAELLSDGLMLLPQQTAFMRELAPLWMQSGQQDDAMALLAQGARIAGANDPRLHGYYASQLLRLKRPAEAQAQYLLALGGNPEQADWMVGLALALQQQGKTAEALDIFRRVSASGKLSAQVQAMVTQVVARLQSQNP